MSEDEVEVLYIVEAILNKRFDQNGRPEYYVKWKGFKQRTWQPIDHLHNVPEMIYEYEEANKPKRRQLAELNPKKAVREQKEPVLGRKRKLVKVSHQENETTNNMIELDSSVENRKSDYMVSSRDEYDQYKDEVSHSPRDHPRVKFTREFPHDSHDIVDRAQKPSLYRDQVQRITAVQKRGGKWMARVHFADLDEVWEQRDIVRLLHPMRLLQFYEHLHRERQKQ